MQKDCDEIIHPRVMLLSSSDLMLVRERWCGQRLQDAVQVEHERNPHRVVDLYAPHCVGVEGEALER